jgi:nucleotide-binding universal stress UspA family protein
MPFQKILVATDFSEHSQRALAWALDLRQRLGAALTVLHVYQIPAGYPNGFLFSADVIGAIEDSARVELAKFVARAGTTPVESKLAMGVPFMEIVQAARSGAHDLIVVGTHGRTGLKHLLIGSVAERVVRLAPCPVLTVP